jgi:hypothetical protein
MWSSSPAIAPAGGRGPRGIAKPVLYVAGNHEFYGNSLGRTRSELKALCAGTHIHVLDDDAVVIGGVRFLGTTLWTDFLLFGTGAQRDAAVAESLRYIRDFSRITVGDDYGGDLFSPDASAALHRGHAGWLANRLAEPYPGPTVVITHHAPSPCSIHPRFEGSLLNACASMRTTCSMATARGSGCTGMHDNLTMGQRHPRRLQSRGYANNGVSERALRSDFLVEVS